MMRLLPFATVLLFAGIAMGQSTPASAPPAPAPIQSPQSQSLSPDFAAPSACPNPDCSEGSGQKPRKQESAEAKRSISQAKKAYEKGQSLEKHDEFEDAVTEYKKANALVPQNPRYAIALAHATQQLVSAHMQRGNALMEQQRTIAAAAQFREALALDPSNDFAQQRLRDAIPPSRSIVSFAPEPQDDAPRLKPKRDKIDLHLRGTSTSVLTSLAQAYGLQAEVDPSVQNKTVELNLTAVDFATAAEIANTMTQTFYVAVSDTQVLFAPNTAQKHTELDRMMLRTFDMTEFSTPAEMNDIVNLLRTVFEVKSVVLSPNSSVMTVKAPQPVMEQLENFFDTLQSRRPQVMLDIEAFEVNRQLMQALGVDIPNQFTVFNLSAAALALQSTNVQNLLNQLISSGAINQGNTSALSALIAQVEGQSTANALLANPLATFGGGLTLFGVGIPPATVQASLNNSRVQTLQSMTLRAAQGSTATFQIGTRYPVINATYAPIYNSAAIAQVLGNQSYVAPVPSVSYIDLGITLKATPQVHGSTEVTLKLELSIKALSSTSLNGIPVISNTEYNGTITVKNGEQTAMIGYVNQSDTRTYTGFPVIGYIPVLNLATGVQNKQITDGELVIVVTPYIVNPGATGSSPLFIAPKTI